MNRRTMTVDETAEYLGVCKDTIYTMVRTDEIPHFRLRRRIFFSQETIDVWIKEQESHYGDQAI
ncbi:helix-turn-helix domain-containing protein [Halobacillus shinanisalinarum]|uniref:Helix-turn-helix domain-containing protein n=1 Tax=Halobacillus shinanisalinarum TaxID=2932258 RepID=A0ABY4H5B8_9BACI|nr:helix-turn-helix domain-containing protein [Halobacillus shinanisalinarum]UOQ95650.1 helix-turn-helix domain-containing protein [Halobacillus shinanisalinarum]